MKKRMASLPDASPLIILSKVERLGLLSELYGEVLLTPWVWEEAVIRGRELGMADVFYLEKTAENANFDQVSLTLSERKLAAQIEKESNLFRGQAEVLAAAKERNALAILDDRETRAMAARLGIAHIGVAGVLYEGFLQQLIDYDQLLDPLETLGQVSWISPDLMAGIMKRARKVNRL